MQCAIFSCHSIKNCSQQNLQYGTFQESNRTLAIKLLIPVIYYLAWRERKRERELNGCLTKVWCIIILWNTSLFEMTKFSLNWSTAPATWHAKNDTLNNFSKHRRSMKSEKCEITSKFRVQNPLILLYLPFSFHISKLTIKNQGFHFQASKLSKFFRFRYTLKENQFVSAGNKINSFQLEIMVT